MSEPPTDSEVAPESPVGSTSGDSRAGQNSDSQGTTRRRRRGSRGGRARRSPEAQEPGAPAEAAPSPAGESPGTPGDESAAPARTAVRRTRRVTGSASGSATATGKPAEVSSERPAGARSPAEPESVSGAERVPGPGRRRTRRATVPGESASGSEGAPNAPNRSSVAPVETTGSGKARSEDTAGSGKARSEDTAGSGGGEPGPARRRTRRPAGVSPAAPPVPPPPLPDVASGAKPRIGDTRPAPPPAAAGEGAGEAPEGQGESKRRRRRGGRGRGKAKPETQNGSDKSGNGNASRQGRGAKAPARDNGGRKGGRNGQASRQGREGTEVSPVEATISDRPVELDDAEIKRRRGKQRKGRPVGRYQMAVEVREGQTHIAILEGRSLIEYYVSRPSDDVGQIHGNIYLGKVQNVLPGMEAAFVDIGTPKNAVLYRGDVGFEKDDIEDAGDKSSKKGGKGGKSAKGRKGGRRRSNRGGPRIEQLLKARQSILCQVTKNPIAHKGARLTTEVSLPGRFVVLVPNSDTYGISKRLPDKERKRLRKILDRVRPEGHGLIVRTAAEDVTAEEIERDVMRLNEQWEQIQALAAKAKAPSLLFREPELAVRVIREEFTRDYRGVTIDDRALYEQVKGYMETITPALADRIEYYDRSRESLPLFERFHVQEQLLKALDRKVWLPSGGSLIIEHTEALTVIDVNTGKNVGKSNLEETVFRNNLEAAEEIAKQLRLRDIGGIIVIDFVDMEIKANRDEVVRVFNEALARDKTRTHVSTISELGLVQMTRKRIGEGLLESVSHICPVCEGRGVRFDEEILG
ncbi:MAG TPA: Rne/Rng family ribonuclease [Acidimicrobiales bacterium]|nr:Rne/Rng family ribonuclease [Acidimicrobiales bacterium]